MARPWIRLDSGFYLDRRLRAAGSSARLIWPHVLCLMRQHSGMLSDGDLDPEALADVIGSDADTWRDGIDGLKGAGLLVFETHERHRGRGIYQEVSGWVTPNWNEYQPDHRARSDRRSKSVPGTDDVGDTLLVPGNNNNVSNTTGVCQESENDSSVTRINTGNETVPGTPKRSQGLPNSVGQPVYVYVDSNTSSSSTEKLNGPRDQYHPDAVALDKCWQKLSGARPREGTEAERKRMKRWERYLKEYSHSELKSLVTSLSLSPWWRGKNGDGTDVFRLGPSKFLNKPENVEALIMRAQLSKGPKLIESPYPDQYTDEIWTGMTEEERSEYSDIASTGT